MAEEEKNEENFEAEMSQIDETLKKLAETLLQLPARINPATPSQGINLQSFDENNETFDSYLQRIENYLDLRGWSNKDEESDKICVKILLNCLSPKLYHTLTCLTAPDNPKTKKFDELIKLLRSHLCPIPSEISEQHKFSNRVQHEGESISNYQADLKKLSTNCNFKCNSCQISTNSTHLRSQFVRGIRDNDVRERLLQQDASKTFEDAVKLALAIESSKLESKEIRNRQSQVNQVKNNKKNFPKKTFSTFDKIKGKCFKCGDTNHRANKCPAKNLKCYKCKKNGHVQEVCLSKNFAENRAIDLLSQANYESDSESIEDINTIKIVEVNSIQNDKFMVNLNVENSICEMEMDTGAAVSTMALKVQKKLLPNIKLQPTSLQLRTYTGEIINPVGKAKVNITFNNKKIQSYLYVVNANVDSIFGRDWIRKLNFKIADLNLLENSMNEKQCKNEINKIMDDFKDLFVETTGTIPNYKCKLELQENFTPKFIRHRPVPYALKDKIEKELLRLENNGTIEKVEFSEWGTPIVPVVKKNGDIRLCADYKVTINKCIKDDSYPIPTVDDIFARMSGGKFFMTLDLHQAYLHMEVDDTTSILQAISTHKGTYKVKRLMFGVKAAPKIWQRFMDSILQDIDGVSCFFDDIKLQGSTYEELMSRFKLVLQRLRLHGLHLNKNKCQFLLNHITYLGHYIDKFGIKPMDDKIQSIRECGRPTNVSETRTFLGLVNYYHKFLPKLASRLQPLYKLLRNDVKFFWSTECEKIFKELNSVISHIDEENNERPIAFASRTLTKAEKNYSQIDKEATAIYWGLKKFFQYCYGRKITLITDHKPLTRIFHPNKDLPAMSAVRLLHYANFLSGFNYEIQYRNTKDHGNADFLSRFPNKELSDELSEDKATIFQLNQIGTLPVTQKEIQREILKDSECRQYYNALQKGEKLPYGESEEKFSLENQCIFNGIRVMIPKALQKRILDELHIGHSGIVRMKALARSYVWWRGIDKDIEAVAKSCYNCCKNKSNPSKEVPHPWEYPTNPWQRVHIDYAGPFMNTHILIVVDAYTKWVEAIPTKTISSIKTIKILLDIFARFGLPIVLVSDNGTNFTSQEFQEFTKSNGIRHKFCAPYHPSSNGQAERYVGTVKEGLRAMANDDGDLNLKLNRFLMQYRKMPNATTGVSPAELMFKRTIRTRIDLVKTEITSRVLEKQTAGKEPREFLDGELVQARFYQNKCCKWKFGKILRKIGSRMYEILIDNEKHTRHVDQLRKTDCCATNDKINFDAESLISTTKNHNNYNTGTNHDNIGPTPETRRTTDLQETGIAPIPSAIIQSSSDPTTSPTIAVPISSGDPTTELQEVPASPRRSTRVRRAPNRLDL